MKYNVIVLLNLLVMTSSIISVPEAPIPTNGSDNFFSKLCLVVKGKLLDGISNFFSPKTQVTQGAPAVPTTTVPTTTVPTTTVPTTTVPVGSVAQTTTALGNSTATATGIGGTENVSGFKNALYGSGTLIKKLGLFGWDMIKNAGSGCKSVIFNEENLTALTLGVAYYYAAGTTDSASIVRAKEGLNTAQEGLNTAQERLNTAEETGGNVDGAQEALTTAQAALTTAEAALEAAHKPIAQETFGYDSIKHIINASTYNKMTNFFTCCVAPTIAALGFSKMASRVSSQTAGGMFIGGLLGAAGYLGYKKIHKTHSQGARKTLRENYREFLAATAAGALTFGGITALCS